MAQKTTAAPKDAERGRAETGPEDSARPAARKAEPRKGAVRSAASGSGGSRSAASGSGGSRSAASGSGGSRSAASGSGGARSSAARSSSARGAASRSGGAGGEGPRAEAAAPARRHRAPASRPAVTLPLIGRVVLPPPDRLAFYAALGLLSAFNIIEWPLALVIGLGHFLAEQRLSRVLRGIGQAAEAV